MTPSLSMDLARFLAVALSASLAVNDAGRAEAGPDVLYGWDTVMDWRSFCFGAAVGLIALVLLNTLVRWRERPRG